MSLFTISQFAFCVLVMCTISNFCLGAENKDSGKTDAHRLGWGGAIASAGYPGYPPGAYAGVGGYGRAPYPYGGSPYGGSPYGGFPAYPPAAYPDPYYGASPWSFKTNDGKKLPE